MPPGSLGMAMKRREFFAFFVGVVSWPFTARAQTQSGAGQVPGASRWPGRRRCARQIATLQGGATVTRAKAAAAARRLATLSLSANAHIVRRRIRLREGRQGQQSRVQHCARHGRFRCEPRGKDRRHDDHDADIDAWHSRHHRRRRCSRQRRARRRRRGEDQALPGCRWACRSDRCVQSAGRAARRPDARSERIRDPPWRGRALRCRAVPDSGAGSGARPRRGAAAVRVTQCRAPDDLAAPATARTKSAAAEPATEPAAEPAAAKSAWAAGRSAAAEFESPAEGQPDRAAARRRSAGEA